MGYNEIVGGVLRKHLSFVYQAYSESVSRITRATVTPIIESLADALTESISQSVRRGIQDALDPRALLGTLTKGK